MGAAAAAAATERAGGLLRRRRPWAGGACAAGWVVGVLPRRGTGIEGRWRRRCPPPPPARRCSAASPHRRRSPTSRCTTRSEPRWPAAQPPAPPPRRAARTVGRRRRRSGSSSACSAACRRPGEGGSRGQGGGGGGGVVGWGWGVGGGGWGVGGGGGAPRQGPLQADKCHRRPAISPGSPCRSALGVDSHRHSLRLAELAARTLRRRFQERPQRAAAHCRLERCQRHSIRRQHYCRVAELGRQQGSGIVLRVRAGQARTRSGWVLPCVASLVGGGAARTRHGRTTLPQGPASVPHRRLVFRPQPVRQLPAHWEEVAGNISA